MVSITLNPIQPLSVLSELSSPQSGGIDMFLGTTRNHSKGREVVLLEYEAYEPMAIKVMEEIEQKARAKWPLEKVIMIHRIGRVPVEEASVAIGVSAAHRAEAFEACRYLIDTLKSEAPIWKREHFADGSSEWSGPQMDARGLVANAKTSGVGRP